MADKDDFVHAHLHSDFSSLDGACKIDDYVDEAVKRGNPAIAITDHGTCRGILKLHEATKDKPIKPLYGSEFYVSKNMRRKGLTDDEKKEITKGLAKGEHRAAIKKYEDENGIRDRWHTTIIAQNEVGLRNLYRLSTNSYVEGFYYRPRIDIDELEKYKEGLIVTTGCLSSPVNDCVLAGREREAFEMADRLYEMMGENLYIEIQPHAIRDQRVTNKWAIDNLYERYDKKARLLATQDAHYLNQSDAEHHEVLLCIGTGSNMSDPDRFKFDGDEFHMRTRKEMFAAYRRHHEYIPKHLVTQALNSTIELAERCDAKVHVDYKAALLPRPERPEKYTDDFQYLKDLCLDGWRWRAIDKRARDIATRRGLDYATLYREYGDRLKHELRALATQKFVPYFLLVREIYAFARQSDIMIGPGRGSVGGSLIAYLLGITIVDPIEHGLIFERFINPFRFDLPDVDMDFEDKRRHEIIEWLITRFGRENVSQIATIGKLSGKACLKDVSRVLGVPLPEVMKVTSSIIERSSGDERASQTIEDSFKDFEVCKQFNEKYPKVLHHAKHLENLSKTLGIHAAGVVTSPVPLATLMPMEIRKHNGHDVIVTAYDMYGVAAMGLAKLDVLGLRTLTVIKEALKAIKDEHGVVIDFEAPDFNLNDPKVLQAFTDHDYGGVFQYDTPSADKICAGVKFTDFEDIAAMTALNRPGTARSGLATKYVERKKNPKLVSKIDFHETVSKITSDTLGIIVYQEHVIKIFTECAGFAPGTADSLRKTIAKKVGDETIGRERAAFVEGCAKHSGIDAPTANKIMDAITFFGSYGFNKSHATEYGMISYWTQYLKVYYPLEFYWALLKNEPDRIRIAQYAKQAKKHGIELLPPHVNISKTDFVIDRAHNAIRGSLVDIKGVGPGAADTIMEHQPFKDWFDMQDRVNKAKMHKGVNIALAKSGALKGLVPSTKWFLENIEEIWKIKDKKRQRKIIEDMFDKAKGAEDFNDEDMALQASSVNPLAFGKHPIDAYKEFIERAIKFEAVNMSSDDFFTDHGEKGTWIQGVILEVKYNQIGDFHTGPAPTEEEKHDMFWGARYANVNIEDAGGKQNRCKFDIDIFDACRHVIDAGIGTPVVAHVIPNSKFLNLRAQLVVNLASLRDRMKSGVALDVWERIVTGRHPALSYEWKDKETRHKRVFNVAFKASPVGGTFVGVVTNVRLKYDRNGNLMAFFGLMAADGFFIDVIAFHSNWEYVAKAIKQGYLVKCLIEKKPDRTRGWSYFCGDRVKVLSKPFAGTPTE